jgi:methylmalonyl-CoA mutase
MSQAHFEDKNPTAIARLISAAENFPEIAKKLLINSQEK